MNGDTVAAVVNGVVALIVLAFILGVLAMRGPK